MDGMAQDLLAWYDRCARVLPWRSFPSPYRTWLSEVMLQQTQVDTVMPYYHRFLAAYPRVEDLAAAPLDEVLSLWSGLGYYSRARNMHKTAKMVTECGTFPFDIKGLRALPGVGEYMSAAIASIALGIDAATVDGNIARVMARLHADPGPRKAMWVHASAHLPAGRAGDYNQALMDLGARICRPKSPKCGECPVDSHCQAFADARVSEFPPPKKKRVVPEVFMHARLFRRDGFILFGRRPVKGLWGGLWEFPAIELAAPKPKVSAVKAAWRSEFGIDDDGGQLIFERKHVLTHRIYRYQLVLGVDVPEREMGPYSAFEWMNEAMLSKVGLSTLTTKALAAVRV